MRVPARTFLVVAVLVLAGCGGGSSSGGSGGEKVWCVAPGEQVTPELKREYPELYMDKQACDAVNEGG